MNNPIIEKAISIAGTQEKLSELSGVSQATIHKLLVRKSKDMRSKTALGLSNAIGITVADFIEQFHSSNTTNGSQF